jgi:hypothetical protein
MDELVRMVYDLEKRVAGLERLTGMAYWPTIPTVTSEVAVSMLAERHEAVQEEVHPKTPGRE